MARSSCASGDAPCGVGWIPSGPQQVRVGGGVGVPVLHLDRHLGMPGGGGGDDRVRLGAVELLEPGRDVHGHQDEGPHLRGCRDQVVHVGVRRPRSWCPSGRPACAAAVLPRAVPAAGPFPRPISRSPWRGSRRPAEPPRSTRGGRPSASRRRWSGRSRRWVRRAATAACGRGARGDWPKGAAGGSGRAGWPGPRGRAAPARGGRVAGRAGPGPPGKDGEQHGTPARRRRQMTPAVGSHHLPAARHPRSPPLGRA